MAFEPSGLDSRTALVVLLAGLVFVVFLGLAATGNVAAMAGSETSICHGSVH